MMNEKYEAARTKSELWFNCSLCHCSLLYVRFGRQQGIYDNSALVLQIEQGYSTSVLVLELNSMELNNTDIQSNLLLETAEIMFNLRCHTDGHHRLI